jgi:hypothetical protein
VPQQTDRQVIRLAATTKQLDRSTATPVEARDSRFQRDGGGSIGIRPSSVMTTEDL